MQIQDTKKIAQYYKALVEKDRQFVGVFYVGVKTTGIFCISICTARKPKLKNVEFFTTTKELLQHGYRPCKVCKPTQNAQLTPPYVLEAIELANQKPKDKLKDFELRNNGLNPEKIRRWFKKNYGITFQAYQRMLRINTAFQELQKGKKVTESAFSSGYESLSGFGYTFKRIVGASPNESVDKTIILINRFSTKLGPMFVCATQEGVCLLEFTDRRMLETEFKDLQQKLNAIILVGENEHIKQTKIELTEYFDGKRKKFTLPLHTPGTDFQQSVWNNLQKIAYGKTNSYQEQAIKINNPKAVRAVARANGCNRVAIVIPCHRVIGKDGSLTGYAGGLERKRWLLDHEKKNAE